MGRAARDKQTGMTDKEEKFCQYIVNDPECGITSAYEHAYNCERMKKRTITNKAHELMKRPRVKNRIDQLRRERSERTQIDSDYVLTSLYEARELDIIDILDDAGNVLPVRQWPKAWRINISGLDLHEVLNGDTETIIRKVKLPDKKGLLELIGKHVGVQAFRDSHEVTGKDGQPLVPILNVNVSSGS